MARLSQLEIPLENQIFRITRKKTYVRVNLKAKARAKNKRSFTRTINLPYEILKWVSFRHNGQYEWFDMEQITKADRLRESRTLRKKQSPRHTTAA